MLKIWYLLFAGALLLPAQYVELSGGVADPQGKAVVGATVTLERDSRTVASTTSDQEGRFRFRDVTSGNYRLRAEAHEFATITRDVSVPTGQAEGADLQFHNLAVQKQSLVITAKSLEPEIDLRNAEVFN